VQGGWFEGFRLAMEGKIWRDEKGPWQKSSSEYVAFRNFIERGISTDENIAALWNEQLLFAPRVVATLGTNSLKRSPLLRITLGSLLRQRLRPRRIYVFVRSKKTMRHCVPSWLRSRPRVVALCDRDGRGGAPLTGLLAHETAPNTLILLVDDRHHYGDRLLANLVPSAHLWAGSAVASSGVTFGMHGGPIGRTSLGVLFRRSFLDTRIADDVEGPCEDQLELVVAAHLVLKGVNTRIIGHAFGSRTLVRPERPRGTRDGCRRELIHRHGWLWASKKPERCTLFVSLLEGTDVFLLDLTIRYAGLQTRKPDEVVLLASSAGILASDLSDVDPIVVPGDAEVELRGSFGGGDVQIKSPAGTTFDVPLHKFLAYLRDRAGCVARVHSSFGPPRSFVLSVATCSDHMCAVQPSLRRAFEYELDPNTVLMFVSAERLVNERLMEDNYRCLTACAPRCGDQNWCGQSPAVAGMNALYDLTVRRAAGYVNYVAY